MYIQVSKDFRIKADQHCYILESRATGKIKNSIETKDVWTSTYYPTYAQIGKAILERSLNNQDLWASCENLAQLGETLERLAKTLGEQIQQVGEV